MDVSKRVKGIMLAPETEWSEIEKEPGTPAWLFTNYVVYLAAIPPIAGFIGGSLIGITVPPMGTFRVPLFAGLLGAVITYLLNFVIVYAVAIIDVINAASFFNWANRLMLSLGEPATQKA